MPGTKLAAGRSMPTRESVDMKTRLRMAGNLRRLYDERRFPSVRAMAARIGVHWTTLYKYMRGEQTIGMDVALKVHRALGVSLDWFVDEDPPEKYFRPLFGDDEREELPRHEPPDRHPKPPSFSHASSASAGRGRRSGTGATERLNFEPGSSTLSRPGRTGWSLTDLPFYGEPSATEPPGSHK